MQIIKDKIIHCVELNTGKNLPGIFMIGENSIETKILSYDGKIDIDVAAPVFLRTEDNHVVSLYANIARSTGSIGHSSSPFGQVHHQHVVSNIAVVGYDRWLEQDVVRRVTFTVAHAQRLVKHRSKYALLATSTIDDGVDPILYSERAQGMTLRARHRITFLDTPYPEEISPYFEIEFDDDLSLYQYIRYVRSLVHFLSFSLGASLTASNLEISRYKVDELKAAYEDETYCGDYSISYDWPEPNLDSRNLQAWDALVVAWDDKELASFCQCLVTWMDRLASWEEANNLMIETLGLQNEMSQSRLLTACRWFEAIPSSSPVQSISDEDIEIIARSASLAAEQLGYMSIKNRVYGIVKYIKKESHGEQFKRLIDLVKSKINDPIMDKDFVDHLRLGFELRGKVAHGNYYAKNQEEFSRFAQATRAVEAFCFLLTAWQLPISPEGVGRSSSHPMLRDYRYSRNSRLRRRTA